MKRNTFNNFASISFLLGMVSILITWQRLSSAQVKYGYNSLFGQRQPANMEGDNAQYAIHFAGLKPWVMGAAMAYHSNNPVLGLVASWPLWITNTVSAHQALPTLIDFNNTLPSNLGFIVQGDAATDMTGQSVAGAGDVNGDGKADFIVGAYGVEAGGRTQAGAAYVIYGHVVSNQTSVTSALSISQSSALTTISTTRTATTSTATTAPTTTTTTKKPSVAASSSQTSISQNTGSATPTATQTTSAGTPQTTAVGQSNTTPLPGASTPTSVSSIQQNTDLTITPTSQTVLASSTFMQASTPISQDLTAPAVNSPTTSLTPIIAGASGRGLLLAACLAGIGFYACRKKSSANQSNNLGVNNLDVPLQNIQSDNQVKQSAQQYGASSALVNNSQAGNQMYDHTSFRSPVDAAAGPAANAKASEDTTLAAANYANMDAFKKIVMQYDNAPVAIADDLKMQL